MASKSDRIEGVLLGLASGDALGAPYEFQPPRGPELEVVMAGGAETYKGGAAWRRMVLTPTTARNTRTIHYRPTAGRAKPRRRGK